jgi:hypothetical protein
MCLYRFDQRGRSLHLLKAGGSAVHVLSATVFAKDRNRLTVVKREDLPTPSGAFRNTLAERSERRIKHGDEHDCLLYATP